MAQNQERSRYPHQQPFNLSNFNKTRKQGWWLQGKRKKQEKSGSDQS